MDKIPKTAQEIFDSVWIYFIVEGKPQATDAEGTCCYRGETSNCAVGCQLPDELYSPKMEGKSIYRLFNEHEEIKTYFGAENERLLGILQRAHDGRFLLLKENLRHIAKRFYLSIPNEPR